MISIQHDNVDTFVCMIFIFLHTFVFEQQQINDLPVQVCIVSCLMTLLHH